MKAFAKTLITLAATAAAMAMTPAQAVVVSFGGVTPTDGSGQTSQYAGPGNTTVLGSGFYGETFDVATANAALGAPMTAANPAAGITIQQNNGCAINSWAAVGVSVTGGGFSVRKGTATNPSGAAAPAGDSTCFGFGPQIGQPVSGAVPAKTKVDYTNLLAGLSAANSGATFRISYLGVYYGSIDNYNDIAFYSGGNTLLTGGSDPLLTDGVLTGAEILGTQGGTSGNQFQPQSNVYVNLAFDGDESFKAFEFRTTGVAFELDNIWVGVTQVPEPESLALVGLGLLGLAASRRRKPV